MAIYTQYARYLKAREFKKMVEDQGDTYMLLGLGNPYWDGMSSGDGTVSSGSSMPVAPYSTAALLPNTGGVDTQFTDTNIYQYFTAPNISLFGKYEECTISNSVPAANTYMSAVKNLLPPFPCTWQYDGTIYHSGIGTDIKVSELHEYYISTGGESGGTEASPILVHVTPGERTALPGEERIPTGIQPVDSVYRQAYAEMYLRGLSLKSGCAAPVGLLGAVRCSVNFVKDMGSDDTNYSADNDIFWYGDRYWKIIDAIDDDPINDYINVNGESDKGNDILFPYHLLFNATINPRQLCSILDIDQNIVPRQIAIFSRKREDPDTAGPKYYKVGENVFNFGQYKKSDYANNWPFGYKDTENTIPLGPEKGGGVHGEFLNFTLPVKVAAGASTVYEYPGGNDTDFKFILNDYIKGSVRDKHSIDRIGYVLGF